MCRPSSQLKIKLILQKDLLYKSISVEAMSEKY